MDLKERKKYSKEYGRYSTEIDSICAWCGVLRQCVGTCPFYDIEFEHKYEGYMKKYGCPNYLKPIDNSPKRPKTLNEAIQILNSIGYFGYDDD